MKKKKARCTGLDALAIALTLGVLAVLYLPFLKQGEKPPLPSKEEMRVFWNTYLKIPLTQSLYKGTFPIPVVQERYTTLKAEIEKKYGKEFVFKVILNYLPKSQYIIMANGIETGGVPTVYVFMPAVMNSYHAGVRENLTEEERLLSVAIGLLHELDHLFFNPMQQNQDAKHSATEKEEELVRNEIQIWALTCEYTLSPLVEKHGYKLVSGDLAFYRAWTNFGRSVQNPMWERFMWFYYHKVMK